VNESNPEAAMSRTALVGLLTLAGALPCLAADDDKWSTVKGRVAYDDSKVPIPKRVAPNTKGAALPPCAAMDKYFLTEDWVVDAKTKGIRDVVVWLAPEPTADQWRRLRLPKEDDNRLRTFPTFRPVNIHPDLKNPSKVPVVIDQPCCRFIPHQAAIRVGQTLVIKNSAAFAHNANYTSTNNGSDNPLIPEGKEIQIPIGKPERNEMKITCNIHGWMSASVRVFDHPYFAVTNEKGEYEIKNAPVGQYRIFVWHSTGGMSGGSDGLFGYDLKVTPKKTDVKDYAFVAK
jgi:hypothetical protein